MRIVGVLFIAGLMTAAPAFCQIVTPNITPPPCTGNGCLQHSRGIPMPAQTHKLACPSGTVYVQQKGTCKVLPVTGH